MKYLVEYMHIERHDCPSNDDIDGHIKNMYIENLGEVSLQGPIAAGEIIVLPNGSEWMVQRIIHKFPDNTFMTPVSILRVFPYRDRLVHYRGSNSWTEVIPLFPDDKED